MNPSSFILAAAFCFYLASFLSQKESENNHKEAMALLKEAKALCAGDGRKLTRVEDLAPGDRLACIASGTYVEVLSGGRCTDPDCIKEVHSDLHPHCVGYRFAEYLITEVKR